MRVLTGIPHTRINTVAIGCCEQQLSVAVSHGELID